MLKVSDLHCGYGKIEVLKGISLSVPQGKIVSLIGSNGAGKTTFLMTLSALVKARSGSILFDDREIHSLSPDSIVKLGIVHVPEGRRIFAHLTVSENLDLGAYTRDDADVEKDKQAMLEQFPILRDRLHGLAGNLSGGEQQMLAMARALMGRPKLLLLDEPSLGLAPKMVAQVFELIQRIRARGITVLLVEQNANQALSIADYAYVIESGRIELEGSGQELLHNPKIRAAYLGG